MNAKRFIAAALSSVFVFSAAAQAAETVFDGFYLGGKVTGEASKYKNDVADGLGASGFGAGLFGGYRTLVDSFCIGAEGSIRYAGDKFSLKTINEEYKRSYVAGLHVLAGTVINSQFLIAGKIGIEHTPYKLKVSNVETKKKKTALNLGVLFEMPVADSLCIRAEGSVSPNVSLGGDLKATHQSYGVGLVYKVN